MIDSENVSSPRRRCGRTRLYDVSSVLSTQSANAAFEHPRRTSAPVKRKSSTGKCVCR